jgi:DNA-binding response OmpR family regulator
MVVDDDEDVLFLLRIGLEREGFEVLEVRSGEECLSRVDEFKPDLILLDIMMSGLDGWETCRRIKARRDALPVCMLSVRRDDEDISRSLEYAHADGHMNKPVDFNEVMTKIGEFKNHQN